YCIVTANTYGPAVYCIVTANTYGPAAYCLVTARLTRCPLLPGHVLFSRPKKCVRQGFQNRPGFCLVGSLCFSGSFTNVINSSRGRRRSHLDVKKMSKP